MDITTPMGVATYDNVYIEEIQKQLPTLEQIQTCIEQAEADIMKKYEENDKKCIKKIWETCKKST